MLAVRESVLRQFGKVLDDATIERVLRHGKADIADRYLTAIRETAAEYVSGIFRRLREHEYDPELMKLHVVGGGSCLVKNFGDYEKSRVIFNDDICATAKGKDTFGKHYDADRFRQADREVSELLGEPHPQKDRSVVRKLQRPQEQSVIQPRKHENEIEL